MMNDSEMDDATLLDRLAQGDRSALAEIARRHVDLVHAAARRQTRDAHQADDVTQAVFLTLTRKAGSIRKGTHLVGWLYMTTRNIALTARRAAIRRDRHEAAASVPREVTPTADNETILPLLDDAIHDLPSTDREAVLLRFFNRLPFADVGVRLGTTEEAARKRVTRAIERLRTRLVAHGATASIAAVTTLLAAESANAAPAATVASVTGTASASATSLAATAVAVSSPAKIVACVAAVLVVGGSITATAVVLARRADATPLPLIAQLAIPASPAPATLPVQDVSPKEGDLPWFAAFQKTYGLAPGQVIRHVRPPFIAEREDYFRWLSPRLAASPHDDISYIVLNDSLDRAASWGSSGPGHGITLNALMQDTCALQAFEVAGPAANADETVLMGDWVYDRHASKEERLRALAAAISADTKTEVTFEPHEREDDVVIITNSTPPAERTQLEIATRAGPSIEQIEMRGPLSSVFNMVSYASRRPVFDERPSGLDEQAGYYIVTLHHTGDGHDLLPEALAPREDVEALMTVLAEKLHFTFKIEKRKWTVWELAEN